MRPGPRVVLGGLLVAAAAVVVFAAAFAAAGGHKSSYAVAAQNLPAGSTIGPGDLTTAALGLNGATESSAYRSGAALIGRTVAVPIRAGQLIEAPMLSNPAGPDLRPVSVAVDGNSLVALQPGDEVDVLAFGASSDGASVPTGSSPPASDVVMRGATLLSVDRSSSGLLGTSASGSTVVVTLGVNDLDEAEAVISAAHAGTVELVMAEPGDGSGSGPGVGS
jgi:Flp pilus assembly protein CpaB